MVDPSSLNCPITRCGHPLLLHDMLAYGVEGDSMMCKVCYANGKKTPCASSPEA